MGIFNNGKLLKEARFEIEQKRVELENTRSELQNANDNLLKSNEQLEISRKETINILEEKEGLLKRYASIIDKENELKEIESKICDANSKLAEINEKYQNALKIYFELEKEIELYKDNMDIRSFGLYQPRFNFDTSDRYKSTIDQNYEKQKQLIKNDEAAICHTVWEVGGNKAEGRKMTQRNKKLMLYAFNGECDAIISKVKWNNATKSKERILKAFESINKLGMTTQIEITSDYLNLKLEEFGLTFEYEQKKYFEKEEQRRLREQMREEEKAQKELERAQREAEEEEERFLKALNKAKSELGNATQANVDILNEQVKLLEQKLKEAHERKERAMSLAQQTKVGHIYVISNVGSFGEDVYKIGMTRRFDPLDRVKELGDASVPFQFDIHAIIYSENAPQFEYELHRKFSERRLNKINSRKEFFKVTLDEIEIFVNQSLNASIEFTKLAEAREYRETLSLLEQLNKIVEEPQQENKFPNTVL